MLSSQGDASDAKDSEAKEGPYWSLMFEISESKLKPVNQKPIGLAGSKWPEIVKETIIGALNTKMVDAKDEIVSVYHRCCSVASPNPLLCLLSTGCSESQMHHLAYNL